MRFGEVAMVVGKLEAVRVSGTATEPHSTSRALPDLPSELDITSITVRERSEIDCN